MSDLDLDIRSIANAAFGGRGSATDTSADRSASGQAVLERAGEAAAGTAASQLRYDSFRFIYKPDYGRIVLIDQSPVTGEQISQIPSQRALELYAEQRRSEARSTLTSDSTTEQGASSRRLRMTASVAASTVLPVAPSPVIAPAQISAMSATAAKPVNITI